MFRVSITAKWEKGRRLRVKTPSGSVHTVLQRRLFQLDSHRFHLCAAAAAAAPRHTMRPFRPWAFSVFVIRHSPPLRISTRVCVERIKKKRRKGKQNPKALRSSTGRKEVPGSVITGRLVRRPAFSARAASREDWSRPERVRFLHGTFNRRLLS